MNAAADQTVTAPIRILSAFDHLRADTRRKNDKATAVITRCP
jgi:hypothetical protein